MNFCTKEQERSIKTVIKRFFRKTPNGDLKNLESLISAELGVKDYKLNDVLTEDITKLLNLFGVKLSSDIDSTPSFKSNVVEEISSFEVDDLFHGLNLARAYFKNYVDSLVVKNYLIGYGDSYVNSDEELTKNFLRLKGDLFNKIQEFLISRNIINLNNPLNLYNDSFQITDYNYYKTIMQKISDYFFSGENFNLLKSYSGKNIPNIDRDMDIDSDIYEAYFNMIILSNFDTILKKDFNNLISVNNLYYNELISNSVNNTYTRVFIPESTLYWSNETHMEEGVESQNVKLAEMVANTIPAYDKNNVKTLYNLEMNDFYLLGSIIANFELLHGNKLSRTSDFKYFSTNVSERLQWYIETIKDVLDGKISDKLLEDTFSPYANIIYSLYNYLNDSELNILNKEKNSELSIISILGQVINNTFGASYTVIDSEKGITIQQMYSEDFNSTSINNTIYSKMVSNSHNKSYYDLQNSVETEKFLSVFSNIDLEMSAKDALSKNLSFFRRLRKYTYDKLGIKINISGFKTAMESMERTPGARGVFTVNDLKEKYRELLGGMDADFKSTLFKKALQNFSGATKFDSTVGELVESTISKSMFKALSKGYLIDMPIKGVMNIKTLNGESIPSYKIPNLTYKDTELFTQQREYENNTENPKVFKSLLIKDNPAIVGTATKLELINSNKSKPADKYYPVESFIGDLNYEFYDNIVKNKKFNVIIGAYSDKSTIILKTIDSNFTDQEKGNPIIRTSIDNIIEKMRSQGRAYYYDTVKTVLDSYNELFKILGISPFDFNIDINNLDKSVEFINNILSKNNIDQLIAKAQAHHIKITAELHYTKYAEGTYLNQLLIDNYKIFTNDSLFNTFIKNQEAAFLNNYNTINSTIGKTPITGDVIKYMEAVNINKNDYKNENLRDVTLSNGDLNPLIRKWLWTNALFRNEYLYISTKGEYMHKIKGFNKRSGDFNDSYWDSYMRESHARLNAMSKRNVANTSTFESPIRDTKYSIPTKLNMASIRDYKAMPYSITGDKKYTHNRNTNTSEGNQDAHDGSTIIDATYSMMIDASYPSKGYSGTKKQFGTIVTEGGVVIKKDAESVLTNRKILNSAKAPIKGRELKRKMLSIPIGDVNLNYDVKLTPNYFFNDKGRIYRIGEIQLHNIEGKNVLFMSLYKKIGDNWIKQPPVQKDINNLFDLWTAFGGEYSTDIKGNFNESSNELLYKVMTDNLPLKHKLIHILSNESALKAGATNINPKSSWTDTIPFVYATFTSRFMGPQLDASHEANESEIKEVTQIIAALAQGGFTSEIAREAYNDIKNIIEDTAKIYINSLNSKSEDVLYEFLTDSFIRSIVQSDGNNLAKVLVNNLKQDSVKIPFSNQNFYNSFVKDLITRMNTDFISRYYPGLGAILVPSEGMIQLYDVTLPDGTIKSTTQSSLIKEALENYNEEEFIEIYGEAPIDNDHIIQNYITRILPNEPITVDKIEIGDTILWNNKEWIINTPDEYYDFKDLINNYSILNNGVPAPLEKVWNKPRDLKPTMHTFNLENGESRNIFDLTGYKLKHYLDANNSEKYNNILNNLFLYISQKYLGKAIPLDRLNPDHKKLLKSFLNLWTQRDLSLMEVNKLTPEVDEGTIFSIYFEQDDLTKDILEDVIEHYNVNGINISNVKFRPAEIVVADIFKSKFGRDETSLYDIKKQGFKYFQNKLDTFYKKDNTNADIKIVTSNLDKPVYIRFVDNLKRYNENLNLRETFEDGKQIITRYNDQGEKVYNLVNPKYTSAIIENGKEIILIQTGVVIKDDNSTTYHKTPKLDNILSSVISSFKGSIQSLIPLMRDNSEIDIFTYTKKGNVSEVTGTEKFDLNLLSMNQFKRFTGYNKELPLERHSVFANKAVITENLAKIKYANWEKSHDIIASRIPAQSMQSFMPMRVVEYSDDSKNDAFVSISQIFLQGSDFDVDKAYLLGFNFDNRGKYHIWSNLTNFSTKKQIDALEKLPMPTNETIVIDLSGEDITSYYTEIVNTFNADPIGEEFSSETIESFNKLIRFINNNSIKSVKTSYDDPNVSLESIVLAINRHNIDNSGISRIDSLKNGVVSKINRIISSPSNQLLANSPINIDDWHNAVKKVLNNKTTYVKEEVISSFESNNKLNSIGTANQYSRYINSVINGDKRIIESLKNSKIEEAENNYEETGKTYILGSEEDIRGFKKFVEDEGSTTLKARLTPYDIISYYIQQYNASVGKDDVGIAANGVKAFLGLTDYYNNFYKKELLTMSPIEIIRSGKIFNKEFTFFDSTNSPRNYKISAISDLQIPRNSRNIIYNILGDSFNYLNSNAALNLSGFLSGATDNAKELLMAKVNATTDLAAVHMYLTILGLDPDNVVEIMTSKVVEDIIKRREGNLFKDKYQTSISTIMDDLEDVYRGNKILSNNLKVFKDLYYSAKELTSLSSLFGVNQKRKANTWEIYRYLSKFERVFNDTNTNFLGKINVDNLNNANSDSLNNLIRKIIEKNNFSKQDRTYVKDIILKATNILVKYVDYNGKIEEKSVNLIKDGLDFRYYINDPNYKQIAKDYYNLIKHTFNVFDILDSIPHYKGMIDSLVLIHNILLKTSKKYNFVTNTLKDVINIGDTLIQDFSKNYIDEQVINRGIYLFDTMIIENWLHAVAKNVNFKLKDIMQLANVTNYQIYISNEAKNIIKEDGISPTVKTINIDDSSNPVISLDSAYGIAQFKKVFEELILPILQNNLQSDFSDYLKVETVLTPFRTTGSAIVSTFPLQELNNPVFIKQFQKLLNTFDFLDSDSKVKGMIKNSVGNDVKLRDLFFIYNLITNNEKYGNKKLTPIFENYMQEKDSLGYNYIKFWSDFEFNSKGLPIDTSIEDWKENFEDNVLFHIANEKGVLSINRGKFKKYSVDNPHFTLISDISLSREQENDRRNLYETLRVLRERGFIINLKC